MFRKRFCLAVLALCAARLGAQTAADSDAPVRIGPGVTPPRPTRRIEPEYSQEARDARIQGTVMLQIVITEQGRVTDVSVLSPLGFGLDEKAQAAVEKWEFAPGMKAGQPVKVLATVEVNFRFAQVWFDDKAERRRTAFNVAAKTLARSTAEPAAVERAVRSITELSGRKFPPAMFLAGLWKTNGEHGEVDAAAGLLLIQQAAAKDYGPAIYEVALRRIEGRGLPQDVDRGLKEMRQAATLGSRLAQFDLGNRYEKGDGVPREADRARRYFRLCATEGVAVCQYRLGRLLYEMPGRREHDYLQAVALLQLAAGQDFAEAKTLSASESQRLTAEQSAWVERLKRQLVRK